MTLQSACPGGIHSTMTSVVASVGREKTADTTLMEEVFMPRVITFCEFGFLQQIQGGQQIDD